jgi:hypothetical protein
VIPPVAEVNVGVPEVPDPSIPECVPASTTIPKLARSAKNYQ